MRRNLVAKYDESMPLERSDNNWRDNIKIDYEKPAFEDTNWPVLVHDRIQWCTIAVFFNCCVEASL